MNICKLLWNTITSYAPERLASFTYTGSIQSLPIYDGDSFKFEVVFDNSLNTGIPVPGAAASGNAASSIMPRNYYIRYVFKDDVTDGSQYNTQPAKNSLFQTSFNYFDPV